MSKKFIQTVKKIDDLIGLEKTGSARELANKMRVSIRCVYNYIKLMKLRGAPIEYNRKKKTFVYIENGKFYFEFVRNSDDEGNQKRTTEWKNH
jgi:predicted DNA-binding transcriptional regulator YafY